MGCIPRFQLSSLPSTSSDVTVGKRNDADVYANGKHLKSSDDGSTSDWLHAMVSGTPEDPRVTQCLVESSDESFPIQLVFDVRVACSGVLPI